MFSSTTFGDYLRQIRLDRMYSQDEMAARLHMSQNAYCLIENGKTRVTLEHIGRLAEVMGETSWGLMRGYQRYLARPKKALG